MNWETAANIMDTYNQVMTLLKHFDKEGSATIKPGQYPGTCYVETADGDFHRVSEWNAFADKATDGNTFYHVN